MYTDFDKSILSIMDFNVLIRDTIEYALEKNEYNLEAYNKRKANFKEQLEANTPINNFMKNNGEKGEELRKQLQEVYDMIYADESTICQVSGDELRVDKNQAVTVFDLVIPAREQLNSIVYLHLAESVKHKALNPLLDELYRADEKMFRALVWFSVMPEIHKQFMEFNKLVQESKGERTPQANFVSQDIQKLVGHIIKNKDAARINSRDFTDVQDKVLDLLDILSGKKVLREGRTLPQDFKEVGQLVNAYLQGAEKAYNEKAQKAYGEFFEQLKQEKAKAEENKNTNEA